MNVYLVYDQEWEDKRILYCGTDSEIANKLIDDGDQNRYAETWVDGKLVTSKNGIYKGDL